MILYSTKFKEKKSTSDPEINFWNGFPVIICEAFINDESDKIFVGKVCISLNEKIIPSNFTHCFVTLMFGFFYSLAGFNFNIPLLVFFPLVSLFLGWQEV